MATMKDFDESRITKISTIISGKFRRCCWKGLPQPPLRGLV
jgi:hypothetical protein